MPRRRCEVCRTLIAKTALPRRSLCRSCRRRLTNQINELIDLGNQPNQIKRLLRIPAPLAAALLRATGLYDADWITHNIVSVDDLAMARIPGIGNPYNTPEKNRNRTLFIEDVVKLLGVTPVRMLTLPHVRMIDYVLAARSLNITPSGSLVVEREKITFNHINSWINFWWAFRGGVILKGLQAYRGNLSDALREVSGEYNLINMDFTGPWTSEVQKAVENLFQYQRVAEKALFAVTLAESDRWVKNPQYPKVEDLHRNFVIERVKKAVKGTGYAVRYLWHHGYKKGTYYPMITIVFKVIRRASP